MPDPIKKTTNYDPSTGETTFKASWSGNRSSISRGPITPKTTNRTVASRQVSNPASKVVATRSDSAGQRMAVAFKSPTMADRTDKPEIKSSAKVEIAKKPLTRKEVFDIKSKAESDDLAKRYPGMSTSEARIKKQKEAENYSRQQSKKSGYQKSTGGDSSSKQKDASSCKAC